jgi:hypothetical protein
MSKVTDKVKEKLKGAKDKVTSTTKEDIVVEEEAKQKFMTEPTTQTSTSTLTTWGTPYSIQEGSSKISTEDTENVIPVIEERLEVSKKESIDEAKLIKEPVKETKTAEVQLTHEELIIEKRLVDKITTETTITMEQEPSSSASTQQQQKSTIQSNTEISIPLKRLKQ